jgi:hypothetical protein
MTNMLQAIGPHGLVLLHPGGNWGDLWRDVQLGRLQYLRHMAEGYGTLHNWTVRTVYQGYCLQPSVSYLATLMSPAITVPLM